MPGSAYRNVMNSLHEPRDLLAVPGMIEIGRASARVPPMGRGRSPGRAARRGWHPEAASAILAAGDALAFLAAYTALVPFGAGNALAACGLAAVAALALFWSDGLYPGYGIYAHELLRRRVVAMAGVAVLAVPGAALLAGGWQVPAAVLSFLAGALALQLLLRTILRGLLRRLGWWGVPARIIGDDPDAAAFRTFLGQHWQLGIRCADGDPRAGDPEARLALVAGPPPSGEELRRLCRNHAGVIALADIPGTHGAGFRPADSRGEIGLRFTAGGQSGPGLAGRAFDLAVVALVLPFVVPVMLLAAAGIYLVDPGPVFYRQTREGLGGRHFQMLKLRTMYRDAEQRLETLLATDEDARAEWSRHYKLRKDPRVLPLVGNFLRERSIDELPQFINVLLGDMRIVGPRPFPLYHLDAMDAAFRARRCTVQPGITGLWQISGRSTTDVGRQQDLDAFYIDNRSFWFDTQIILGTASAVIRGDGAY
ncbi:sugar transferase [Paracoccus fontiphilus]|uniref:Sugar transferase n=1 Tax=Paracoccus fontiphilus TaxID=1815556 RepID=A0ABV7IFV5_9RHOB